MSARLSVVLSTLGNYAGLARVLDGYAAQEAPRGELRGAGRLRPRRARARRRSRRRSATRSYRGAAAARRDPGAVGEPQRRLARGRGAAGAVHRQRHDPRARGWSPSTSPGTRASRRRRSAVLGHVRWARGGAGDAVHALARPRDPVRLPGDRRARGRLGALLRRQRLDQARARRAGRRLRRACACPTATRTSTSATARTRSACACSTTATPWSSTCASTTSPFYKRRVRRLAQRRAPLRRQAPRARAVVLPHVQPRGATAAGLRPRPPPDPPRLPLDPADRRARLGAAPTSTTVRSWRPTSSPPGRRRRPSRRAPAGSPPGGPK